MPTCSELIHRDGLHSVHQRRAPEQPDCPWVYLHKQSHHSQQRCRRAHAGHVCGRLLSYPHARDSPALHGSQRNELNAPGRRPFQWKNCCCDHLPEEAGAGMHTIAVTLLGVDLGLTSTKQDMAMRLRRAKQPMKALHCRGGNAEGHSRAGVGPEGRPARSPTW